MPSALGLHSLVNLKLVGGWPSGLGSARSGVRVPVQLEMEKAFSQ